MAFIDEHRERTTAGLRWGVEPTCRVLQFAPSTYYAAKRRPPSWRTVTDQELKRQIGQVHRDHFDAYGVEKVWRQLQREGIACGRDRVARLMRELGLRGVVRGKRKRTTVPDEQAPRPADLVQRQFRAAGPNQLWVADLTYVSTWSGFAYVAFITDVFSRRIVGWRVATTLHAELALDALEMAIWTRREADLAGLVHHSDRGGQYLSIRYTERLAEESALTSVGSRGDSYDNALAETMNGLYKAELVRAKGPWRTVDALELATAAWVSWWNTRRLHGALDWRTPEEYEAVATEQQRDHDAA